MGRDRNAGFTTGTPWIPVNPNHIEINAREQLLVVCNLSGHNRIYVPDEVFRHAEVLIHSDPDIQDCSPCAESGILRPYESYVLYM